MFPKFNLSRLSGFAALGIVVAVLGGCAETTSGMDTSTGPQLIARQEVTRARFENPLPRISPAVTTEVIADSHKVAAHRPTRFADVH